MVAERLEQHGARPAALPRGQSRRDRRIDLIRGLSLLAIFFDHIPANGLSGLTFRCFGFCDAAELFVFLAGYVAVKTAVDVFEQQGFVKGLRLVLRRCLVLWGAHAGLVITTVAVLSLRQVLTGERSLFLAPILDDGVAGLLRALSLQALPAFLDILPLYIVLTLAFPLILTGLRWSKLVTIAASLTIYTVANLIHFNLPNRVDLHVASTWPFNPFTWQLIYTIGATFAFAARQTPGITRPPAWVRVLCAAYLVYAMVANDGWSLWTWFSDLIVSLRFCENDPKIFATPWRVIDGVVVLYLALTSNRFAAFACKPLLDPIVACGRHSLAIFSAGCLLTLFGRMAFRHFGSGPLMQSAVNTIGITTMLMLAGTLQTRRTATSTPRTFVVPVGEGV